MDENNKTGDCCKAIRTTATTVITDMVDGSVCSKIKLCGYLKKKRNKVGGWRKLWFVLQDKLLLSYGSKEEYDNKLVSFKDVLNLVPGTMVRPLGGFRFTIETTSQAMYTFHCDDRIAYREWMSMLLDSLSTTPQQPTGVVHQHQQQFTHNRLGTSYAYDKKLMMMTSTTTTTSSLSSSNVSASMEGKLPSVKAKVYGLKSNVVCSASMDSIPYVLDRNLLKCNASLNQQQQQQQYQQQKQPKEHRHVFTTRSYESISQVEHNIAAAAAAAASAPTTAPAVATALTKLKSKSASVVYSASTSTSSSSSLSSASLNPMSCVRMPTIAQSTLELLERNNIQNPNNAQSELHMFCNRKTCHALESHHHHHHHYQHPHQQHQHYQQHHHHQDYHNHQKQHMNLTNSHKKMEQNGTSLLLDNNSNKICSFISGTNTNTTTTTTTCKTIDLVKDHIQRLNIKGNIKEEHHSLDNLMTKQQRHSCLNMTSSINVEQVTKDQRHYRPNLNLIKSNNNINCLSCQLEQAAAIGHSTMSPQIDKNQLEPVYAVVDLQHKYAQRRLRSNSGNSRSSNLQHSKRSNSYDSIIQFSNNNNNNNKEGGIKNIEKRSSLAEDIDGIYEDGDKFFCPNAMSNDNPHHHHHQLGEYHRFPCHEHEHEDEENIYEPINIPANAYAAHPLQQQQQSHQPNRAFWKYLSRLKVKPFLQLTRLSKRNSPDYDVIKLPSLAATNKINDIEVAAAANVMTTSGTTSHFANFRHKFGTQRKSIRARMRKLCVRATPTTSITSTSTTAAATLAGYEPKPFCSDTKNESILTQSSSSPAPEPVSVVSVEPLGAKGYGKHKKFRNRWRTVKLRPRNAVGIVTIPTTSTDDPIIRSGRRFFGGSLPHIRKNMPRVSLFAAQQVQHKQNQQITEQKSEILSHNTNNTCTSSSSSSSPITKTTTLKTS